MSDTYYIKKGNRYLPVGISGPDLYDGLWLVQSKPGSKNHSNLYMRLSDLPDCHDLQILAKVTMLEQLIVDVMSKMWENGKRASLSDVAIKITGVLATQEIKLTQKHFRGKVLDASNYTTST